MEGIRNIPLSHTIDPTKSVIKSEHPRIVISLNQTIMDFFGLDQPMDLLTKTQADGSQVIRKLSRDETRQMAMFKKMTKQEKKLYASKHKDCWHRCVPAILKEKLKGCECEDCDIQCEFQARGIYCLTFRELCGDAPYSPMYHGSDPDKGKRFRPIIKHVCDEKHQ